MVLGLCGPSLLVLLYFFVCLFIIVLCCFPALFGLCSDFVSLCSCLRSLLTSSVSLCSQFVCLGNYFVIFIAVLWLVCSFARPYGFVVSLGCFVYPCQLFLPLHGCFSCFVVALYASLAPFFLLHRYIFFCISTRNANIYFKSRLCSKKPLMTWFFGPVPSRPGQQSISGCRGKTARYTLIYLLYTDACQGVLDCPLSQSK